MLAASPDDVARCSAENRQKTSQRFLSSFESKPLCWQTCTTHTLQHLVESLLGRHDECQPVRIIQEFVLQHVAQECRLQQGHAGTKCQTRAHAYTYITITICCQVGLRSPPLVAHTEIQERSLVSFLDYGTQRDCPSMIAQGLENPHMPMFMTTGTLKIVTDIHPPNLLLAAEQISRRVAARQD